MSRRRATLAPVLFGVPAKWSDRERCWRWHVPPLVARAYQTPTGGWWISGAINSFAVASRAHHVLARAAQELEQHLVAVHKKLGRLIERGRTAA
jgi:hypothetical protein